EAFTYQAAGRPDPFAKLGQTSAASVGGPRPDLNRNKEPLEEFPLDALRMLGTIRTPAGVFALIRAPDNVVHRVTVKNHMGQNYGQIVAIAEAEVSLTELVADGFGGWVQRSASLALTQ